MTERAEVGGYRTSFSSRKDVDVTPTVSRGGCRPPFVLEVALLAIAGRVAALVTFGAELGSVSTQNWIVAEVRTGVAGIVVGTLNRFLPG